MTRRRSRSSLNRHNHRQRPERQPEREQLTTINFIRGSSRIELGNPLFMRGALETASYRNDHR